MENKSIEKLTIGDISDIFKIEYPDKKYIDCYIDVKYDIITITITTKNMNGYCDTYYKINMNKPRESEFWLINGLILKKYNI